MRDFDRDKFCMIGTARNARSNYLQIFPGAMGAWMHTRNFALS